MGLFGAIMAHLPPDAHGGVGGHARACIFIYEAP